MIFSGYLYMRTITTIIFIISSSGSLSDRQNEFVANYCFLCFSDFATPRINRWRSPLNNHVWIFQTAISNTTAHTLFYSKWAIIPVAVVRWIVNIRLSIVMSQGKYNCIRGISPKSKPKYTRTEMKEININNERAVQRGSAEVDLLTLNPSTWIITSKSKHSYIWIKALSSFALVTRQWALPRSCRVIFRSS